MPFPFAVVGGIIAVGGVAAAISAHNEEERAKARRSAQREASRQRKKNEQERKRLRDEKVKKLREQYGNIMSKETADEILGEKAKILGALEGNAEGLRKQGKTVSDEVDTAMEELKALFEAAGIGGCGVRQDRTVSCNIDEARCELKREFEAAGMKE